MKSIKKTKRKSHTLKYKMKGGFILGEKINSGTHGIIYNIKNDETKVAKVFQNRPVNKQQKSLCSKLVEQFNTSCDELDYEYKIQNIIRDYMVNYTTNPYISVPATYEFNADKDKCMYVMDKIVFPSPETIFLNMTDEKAVSNYRMISSQLGISPNDLAYLVGEIFSILHFKLNLDGYDCELILGKNEMGEFHLYFIDFDKVSCFTFDFPQLLYRKIDESKYDEKDIQNSKRLANFLFGSFISMSLLPTNYILKQYFIQGYKKYCTTITQKVLEGIILNIDQYI